MNWMGRAALAVTALIMAPAGNASAETLTSGALLCPHNAHMELMRLADHVVPDAELGSPAYQRNERLGVKYSRVVASRCIVLNSPAEVSLTGRVSDPDRKLTEVKFHSKTYWVDASELSLSARHTENNQ